MTITADTNVLVRALLEDDDRQARLAQAELGSAGGVAISSSSLCELVWVLAEGYEVSADEIGQVIRLLINSRNVVMDRPAAEAGLAMVAAGGDFADGVIAFEGRALGSGTFVSFDRRAVKLLRDQGHDARLLR